MQMRTRSDCDIETPMCDMQPCCFFYVYQVYSSRKQLGFLEGLCAYLWRGPQILRARQICLDIVLNKHDRVRSVGRKWQIRVGVRRNNTTFVPCVAGKRGWQKQSLWTRSRSMDCLNGSHGCSSLFPGGIYFCAISPAATKMIRSAHCWSWFCLYLLFVRFCKIERVHVERPTSFNSQRM